MYRPQRVHPTVSDEVIAPMERVQAPRRTNFTNMVEAVDGIEGEVDGVEEEGEADLQGSAVMKRSPDIIWVATGMNLW